MSFDVKVNITVDGVCFKDGSLNWKDCKDFLLRTNAICRESLGKSGCMTLFTELLTLAV